MKRFLAVCLVALAAGCMNAGVSIIGPGGGGGGTGAVSSVFGRAGAVTAQAGDYTAAQVGADPSGASAGASNGAIAVSAAALGAYAVAQTSVNNRVATGLGSLTNATVSLTNLVVASTNTAEIVRTNNTRFLAAITGIVYTANGSPTAVYTNGTAYISTNSFGGGGGTGAVSSVFGRAGAVTAQAGDYTAAQVGAVATNDSRYLSALTNVPTLQQVVTAGNTATGIGDLTMAGRVVHGSGLSVGNIDETAYGAQQAGYNERTMTIQPSAIGAHQAGNNVGTMTIQPGAYGAHQAGNNAGTMTIGSSAYGAQQAGNNAGTMTIEGSAVGAQQAGNNAGTMTIGYGAYGAQQSGRIISTSSATNNAVGAMQLLDLIAGQSATITADGSASIGLGACVVSNKTSIVAGDGQASHGDGSITAGGGFYGSGANLLDITAAQVGAASPAVVTQIVSSASWYPSFTNSAMVDGVLTISPANGNLQILAPTGGTTLVTFGGATTNAFSAITLCVSNPSLFTLAWSNAIGNTAAMPTAGTSNTLTFIAPYPGLRWSYIGGL